MRDLELIKGKDMTMRGSNMLGQGGMREEVPQHEAVKAYGKGTGTPKVGVAIGKRFMHLGDVSQQHSRESLDRTPKGHVSLGSILSMASRCWVCHRHAKLAGPKWLQICLFGYF